MKLDNTFKTMSKLEIALLIIFIIYLIFPIDAPSFIASSVESPLGMLTVFIVTLYLFLNANPVIAVLYVFVAYELIRRSSHRHGVVPVVKFTPNQAKKDSEMKAMNPVIVETLEEEVVAKLAPIGHSDISSYTTTSFKPVAENVGSASVY